MSVHEAIAALPAAANADHELIRAMATRRFAYCFDDAEDVTAFTAADPADGVVPLYIIYADILFGYDSTDSTTAHDGTTCIVTADGKRYKTASVQHPYSVLDIDTTAQPASPTIGDAYLIPTGATGTDWAGKDGKIGIYTARGWRFATASIGFVLLDQDSGAFYHMAADGLWTIGLGTQPLAAGSVLPSNMAGGGSKLRWIIENQTTNVPPGTLIPQATGSAIGDMTAGGGNAAAFDSTASQAAAASAQSASATSAYIGKNYSAAPKKFAHAIITPSSDEGWISSGTGRIRVYGKNGSAPASATDGTLLADSGDALADTTSAITLASDDLATEWDYLWVAFTASSAVTFYAAEVQFYEPADATDNVAYIIGSSPIGAWAGNAGKIAHGEGGAWVIYTPAEGWRVYDKSQDNDYLYNSTAWITAGGTMKMVRHVYTADGTFSKDTRCIFVDVTVVGGGGGVPSGAGGTSSFGSHCSATGGSGITPGTGADGDLNLTGTVGMTLTDENAQGGIAGLVIGTYGRGAAAAGTGTAAGSGAGASQKSILAADLGTNESVTVGAAGSAAVAGVVIVEEWIQI